MSFRTLLSLFGALLLAAPATAAPEPPSVEAFAMRPIVQDVDLSPSGEHLAVMRLQGRGQNYAISVYETADLSKKPYNIGAEHMDIVGVSWANDDYLLIRTRQLVEVPGGRAGYNTVGVGMAGRVKRYASKLLSVRRDGGPFIELPRKKEIARFGSEQRVQRFGTPDVACTLRNENEWVLVEWLNDTGSGSELFKVNVEDGRFKPVFKQSSQFYGYAADEDGEIRIRRSYNTNDTISMWYRLKDSDEWIQWLTWKVKDRRPVDFVAFVSGTNDVIMAASNNDRDTRALYRYNLEQPDAPAELLFGVDRYDISGGISTRGGSWRCAAVKEDGIVGFSYVGDRLKYVYIDEDYKNFKNSINSALPEDATNRILDVPEDGNDKYVVVYSRGPREPGKFYLLADGKLSFLGQRAAIEPEQLGERKSIWYTARDGMKINAVFTAPTFGKPPYPAIALPHGGPQARDSASYDEWAQLLATRGYAVLQPNFRGSTGFGFEYYKAGDKGWGGSMQDDVDDGMQYLIEKGIADPEQMAIFGWSYGGYSAMVGSMREPNIYRCSIPGAGVSSMELIKKERHRNRFVEVFQAPTIAGVSPIKEMEKVNVPVLLVHGEADLIVDVKHSDMFARELKRLGKPHRYIRFPDAGHTFSTIGYKHFVRFYTELLDFLATDCGMPTAVNPATGPGSTTTASTATTATTDTTAAAGGTAAPTAAN